MAVVGDVISAVIYEYLTQVWHEVSNRSWMAFERDDGLLLR